MPQTARQKPFSEIIEDIRKDHSGKTNIPGAKDKIDNLRDNDSNLSKIVENEINKTVWA